jgi:threonyl-tRNA synthetase
VEKPIVVHLNHGGKVLDVRGVSGKTTPQDIAQQNSLQGILVAKVNDSCWDLRRPLEGDCTLELLNFESPLGKKVFWHSSAHILGEVLEVKYNGSLCTGPPLPEEKGGGFFYDIATENNNNVNGEDYEGLDKLVNQIIKEDQEFERLVISKEKALEMFKFNKYKVELINEKVKDGETTTVYRCGTLIDLCKGPHVPRSSCIKGFSVWKNSSSYWKGKKKNNIYFFIHKNVGNDKNDSLQRVYGISFPEEKMFEDWKREMEEAKKRDHRLQGKKQELFFFHPLSPGSCFWLPRGAKMYHKLIEFIRGEYRKRGFSEVITPNMFNKELWETSGHWQHYKNNMFNFQIEGQDFALKPMNCPGHCLMYKFRSRSYKELPIRFADFGVLHRNELSGTLTGLTRVRRFCQDDAHIFCRPDQISSEIAGCFDFLKHVYNVFGFDFTLELSTRPENFIGNIETWDAAENSLREQLDKFAGPNGWKLNPGDGAFYGPKIDIHVFDALKREHQCATIQLDFNLPERFGLSFVDENGSEIKPVIIHRAIFGSIERFAAILAENTAGKWPFWLSPRPCIVLTINDKANEYALKVQQKITENGYDCDIDLSGHKISKKIRDVQVSGYNYILVVGKEEESKNCVNVRDGSEGAVVGAMTVDQVLEMFNSLSQAKQ